MEIACEEELLLSKTQQKILDQVALILRWRVRATVLLGDDGITIIFVNGETLFFETKKNPQLAP